MLRSRPVQYLGLLLLVLACLVVIFFPIGAPPQPQSYTLSFRSTKPFNQLAPAAVKGQPAKSSADLVDAALVTAFPSGQGALPSSPLTFAPGSKTATITDKAETREEAQSRATRIANAVSKALPGVTLVSNATTFANLPVAPLQKISEQYAIYPFQRDTAVKLGLDLRGGVNLVLQVRRALFSYQFDQKLNDADARDAFVSKVRAALSNGGSGLNRADVNFATGTNNIIEVRTQAANPEEFNAQKTAIDAALRGVSGVKFTPNGEPKFYDPNAGTGANDLGLGTSQSSERLDRTVEIVRARVDKLGVSEPLIQKQLPDRIIVQLPGVNDPQKAVAVIGTTAQMEIRLLPANIVPVPQRDPATGEESVNFYQADASGNPTTPIPANVARQQSELVVPGSDVKPNTRAVFQENGQPAISFQLQGESVQKFADVTRRVQNPNDEPGKDRYIPIFLDERAISAPRVQSAITSGEGQISGGFNTIEEAQTLTSLLNSGALPAPIDVVENRTVSATLGTDSLLKSLRAGAVGLALVALFMILFYRLPGLLANFALVIYCLLNLAVFILLGGTLTLPGIAGFLLAIAMSLDTNILVFERLREEMAIQPTFTAALRAAFSRAWTAILDSHVTTLIAAAVLFFFGTGPVKGFALTLGVGVLLSLFSAISVTRLFMWSIAGAGERNRRLFGTPVARSEVAVVGSSTRSVGPGRLLK